MSGRTTVEPLFDQVMVRVYEAEETVKGGIILPEIAQQRPQMAEVVAVGEVAAETLSVGDQILYRKYTGSEVEVDERPYLILSLRDVLAKVRTSPVLAEV